MGHKSFGIDFGTGTIKIYRKGKGILFQEKDIVAVSLKDQKPIAVGNKAYDMYEKAPSNIHVAFPLKQGIIANMRDMMALWNLALSQVTGKRHFKGGDYLLSIPVDISEIQKRSFLDVIYEGIGTPKKVCLIHKPVADAFGLGIDLEHTMGALVVNIGADTTEISILSLGGVITSKLLPYGGNYFDECIIKYIRKEYNFDIGRKTAEQMKIHLVRAYESNECVSASGRDIVSGLPRKITVSAKEIYPLVSNIFDLIASSVNSQLEHTPPEISNQIFHDGIFLTGGSSWIPGLDQLIANETRLRVTTTKHAQTTVIAGLGYLAENPKITAKYAVKDL